MARASPQVCGVASCQQGQEDRLQNLVVHLNGCKFACNGDLKPWQCFTYLADSTSEGFRIAGVAWGPGPYRTLRFVMRFGVMQVVS